MHCTQVKHRTAGVDREGLGRRLGGTGGGTRSTLVILYLAGARATRCEVALFTPTIRHPSAEPIQPMPMSRSLWRRVLGLSDVAVAKYAMAALLVECRPFAPERSQVSAIVEAYGLSGRGTRTVCMHAFACAV